MILNLMLCREGILCMFLLMLAGMATPKANPAKRYMISTNNITSIITVENDQSSINGTKSLTDELRAGSVKGTDYNNVNCGKIKCNCSSNNKGKRKKRQISVCCTCGRHFLKKKKKLIDSVETSSSSSLIDSLETSSSSSSSEESIPLESLGYRSEEEEAEDAKYIDSNRQIKPNKNDKNLFLREIDIQRLPDKEAYNEAAINEIENRGNNDDAKEDSSTRLKFEEELDESLADVRQRILARRKNRENMPLREKHSINAQKHRDKITEEIYEFLEDVFSEEEILDIRDRIDRKGGLQGNPAINSRVMYIAAKTGDRRLRRAWRAQPAFA